MAVFEWYPRDADKALDGMRALTLEERGAYNTILDLIYQRGGPVPDDRRWVAGWMGVSVRRWSILRASLIAKGKMREVTHAGEPALMNDRAIIVIENQSKLSRKLRESGTKGGNKSAENRSASNENKDLGEWWLEGGLSQAQAIERKKERKKDSEEDKSSSGAVVALSDHPDKFAWDQAVELLTTRGGQTEKQARSFFGRLLSENGLEARDLIPSLARAILSETRDAAPYLRKSAEAISKKRQDREPKRVGFV